jgi:tetrahydromethanopterin S-methyltransferase subunit G
MEDFPTLDKAALNAEIVRALDELVAESKFHAARIKEGFAETDERIRRHRAEEEKARQRVTESAIARETPPSYGDVNGRLERIERTLADIREQMATRADLEHVRRTMATKIELESMNDRIKMVADGYQNVDKRLDKVAELLKRPW